MRGRVPHDEDLRIALEDQIAERNRKVKGRKYFVEPKIGSSPTPDTPPTMYAASPSPVRELNFSRVSPQRSDRYVRADGRRSTEMSNYSDLQESKTAELRAALEAQIEMKKRREAELKARARLESRELLAKSNDTAVGDVSIPYVPKYSPQTSVPTAVNVSAAAKLPENWHSHEFLDLAKKDDDERQRKQTERTKAEALRADLERQIKEKEESRRSQARLQLESEREYEAKQQRIREVAASNERKRQDDLSKVSQQLAQENLSMAQHRNSPSRVRGVESSMSTHQSPPPPLRGDNSTSLVPTTDGGGVVSPLGIGGVSGLPPIVFPAAPMMDNGGDVRSILSRIHNDLLLQRQDFLSPSIFSAIPASNVARLGLGPFQLSNSPVIDGQQQALPFFTGAGELPADRQLVRKNPYLSPRKMKPQTFSMTDWMSPQLATADPSAFASEGPITGYDHVSETLKRNQLRLRQLRFAKHNDDVLRLFLQQDNPAAVAGNYDLPPPSVFHNTQDFKKK
ncbi:Hypothetical protein, putative [Bodo saltans]|uniref:Uncharacterized protein n=1 Tax=Bodo saltans TaxID=75058 RepID=A0A0S4JU09_BODSA|nr:Hypothetical protein, putative [Bodo saltans]|eukprot:CUG94065.1 Hypothetical protein, putative [Bodo saltans]